jgi:hypothetical protein
VAASSGSSYKPSESPEPQGPHLSSTQARAGERRGLYKILVISTLLALVVIALAWVVIGPPSRVSNPHTDPAGLPESAANQPAASR